MKKATVIIISVVLVVGFLALVYYGVTHSRGVPVSVTELPPNVVEVLPAEKALNLKEGISPEEWLSFPPYEIKMLHQAMVLPWGKDLISPISVRSFHNNKDIYVYVQWSDETESRTLGINEFSDACAIMFPLEKEVVPSTIMMGFMGKSNLWQWTARQDSEYWLKEEVPTTPYVDFNYPFESAELFPVSRPGLRSSVNDLIAVRVGTITLKEAQEVSGRGVYKNGVWHVVFKRSLNITQADQGPGFLSGQKTSCVIAVWNGAKSDRGGRKSISNWIELVIK